MGCEVVVAYVCTQPRYAVVVAVFDVCIFENIVVEACPKLASPVCHDAPETEIWVVEACPSVVSPVNHATPEFESCVVEACCGDVSPEETVSDPPVVMSVLIVVVA